MEQRASYGIITLSDQEVREILTNDVILRKENIPWSVSERLRMEIGQERDLEGYSVLPTAMYFEVDVESINYFYGWELSPSGERGERRLIDKSAITTYRAYWHTKES